MRKSSIFFALAIVVTCCSVDKNKVYEELATIPVKGWLASEPVKFDMPVNDTTKAYDILLHLRNSGRYSYSNIWFFIETKSPKGNTLKDTFEIMLADDMGRWLGNGIGDVNNLLAPYKENIMFPVSGIYQVTITQAMREESLKNILDLGLLLQIHQ
jgi:gliding motility-associated lipoprotein GldH